LPNEEDRRFAGADISDAAFVLLLKFDISLLNIDKDRLGIFSIPGGSGKPLVGHYCVPCRLPIYLHAQKYEFYAIFVDTLDDNTSTFRPFQCA
jgi:hypothetical protein